MAFGFRRFCNDRDNSEDGKGRAGWSLDDLRSPGEQADVLSEEDLKKLCALSYLDIPSDEVHGADGLSDLGRLNNDINQLVAMIGHIKECDIEGVEPTVSPIQHNIVMTSKKSRGDTQPPPPRENGSEAEDNFILGMSERRKGDYYCVPKTSEPEE